MDKSLLRRIKMLNILISILLILSFSGNFIKGFRTGWELAEYQHANNVKASFFVVNMKTSLNESVVNGSTNTVNAAYVSPTKAQVVLINPPYSLTLNIANILFTLITLLLLVLLIRIIWKTTLAFGRGEIFIRKNIIRVRTIGILLVAKELIFIALQLVQIGYLTKNMAVPGYHLEVDYWSSTVIVGVLLLLFAEVLIVANRIREEQELTI